MLGGWWRGEVSRPGSPPPPDKQQLRWQRRGQERLQGGSWGGLLVPALAGKGVPAFEGGGERGTHQDRELVWSTLQLTAHCGPVLRPRPPPRPRSAGGMASCRASPLGLPQGDGGSGTCGKASFFPLVSHLGRNLNQHFPQPHFQGQVSKLLPCCLSPDSLWESPKGRCGV